MIRSDQLWLLTSTAGVSVRTGGGAAAMFSAQFVCDDFEWTNIISNVLFVDFCVSDIITCQTETSCTCSCCSTSTPWRSSTRTTDRTRATRAGSSMNRVLFCYVWYLTCRNWPTTESESSPAHVETRSTATVSDQSETVWPHTGTTAAVTSAVCWCEIIKYLNLTLADECSATLWPFLVLIFSVFFSHVWFFSSRLFFFTLSGFFFQFHWFALSTFCHCVGVWGGGASLWHDHTHSIQHQLPWVHLKLSLCLLKWTFNWSDDVTSCSPAHGLLLTSSFFSSKGFRKWILDTNTWQRLKLIKEYFLSLFLCLGAARASPPDSSFHVPSRGLTKLLILQMTVNHLSQQEGALQPCFLCVMTLTWVN